HSWHPQIEHAAARLVLTTGFQEHFRRFERLDTQARRPQEIPEGSAQRRVVVDDAHHPPALLTHPIHLVQTSYGPGGESTLPSSGRFPDKRIIPRGAGPGPMPPEAPGRARRSAT